MRHIIFEAILAREFTSSSCVSLSELYSAATILELNSKQSHGVHSFPSVVVRGPDFSATAYQPVIWISRFAGHGSTWQYPWLAGLKTPPSRKLMTLSFSFRGAASRIHTCVLIHAHDRSEDSVFRHEHQRNRNSALGWGSRSKRFRCLRVDCSLHSHIFALKVDCPLCLHLTRVSSS